MTDTLDADPVLMHGNCGDPDWVAPRLVTKYDVNARLTFTAIKAHEYVDAPEVMRAKVAALAELIRRSEAMITYTGAGISVAAGIDDYATKAKTSSVTAGPERPRVKDWKKARPTKTHRVLTALYEAGHLKHWIQQNHDSLPQKAGYPQHALNEIHGSLHDPANPIVPYEGTLRDDLFEWMHAWQQRSDLCVAMGTSMSGFNCDSVPAAAAEKQRRGTGHGLVIINLQQTPYDDEAALRIFGKVDDVMELLAAELGIEAMVKPMDHVHVPVPRSRAQKAQKAQGHGSEGKGNGDEQLQWQEEIDDVFHVPDPTCKGGGYRVWDLRAGRRVRLTGGPYEGDVGEITGKNEDGHYRLVFRDSVHPIFKVKRRTFVLWLGNWFVEEATLGKRICPGAPLLPFFNVTEGEEEKEEAPQPAAAGGGLAVEGKQLAPPVIGGVVPPPPPPPPPLPLQ
eukprot:g3039.t1